MSISDADLAHVAAQFEAGAGTWADLGAALGVTGETIRKRVKRWRRREGASGRAVKGVMKTENPDGSITLTTNEQVVAGESSGPYTVDSLLEPYDINRDDYHISFKPKTWDGFMKGPDGLPVVVQLHSGTATLIPRKDAQLGADAMDAALERMAEASAGRAARLAKTRRALSAGAIHTAEIDLFDAHLGSLCWAAETGQSYDLRSAVELFLSCVDVLLARTKPYGVAEYIVPLGNDLIHIGGTNGGGGSGGTTQRGTPMDISDRWPEIVEQVERACIGVIDRAAEVAPVRVPIVPGNHDGAWMYMLGRTLSAWYRNDDRVTILNDPAPRKYVTFGATVLGYAHGDSEKARDLALLMAEEAEGWQDARFRGWRLGHFHHKSIQDVGTVELRQFRALAARDAWHTGKGYRGIRSAEAIIHHPEWGPVAEFCVTPEMVSENGRAA